MTYLPRVHKAVQELNEQIKQLKNNPSELVQDNLKGLQKRLIYLEKEMNKDDSITS